MTKNKIKFFQLGLIALIIIVTIGLFAIFPINNLSTTNTLQSLASRVASDLGWDMSSSQPKSKAGSKAGQIEEAKVNRVVDGDTIELTDGQKIRYLYIDTPETVKPNTPVMCYGIDAKTYNKKSVDQKTIFLAFDKQPTDRYGRTLAFIYLNKEDASNNNIQKSLNADMVKKGYAKAVSYSPNTTFKKDFESMMVTAQESKKGAWANCPNPFAE